ncbi:hypothetical protein ACTFIW_000115 [Dictyostelium discoideum]
MKEQKIMLKIIILGDINVGKTSLYYHYVNGKFLYHRTCSNVSVLVWDTFGQERYHALGLPFYRGTNCYILCFDIHNEESFNNLEKWMDEVRTYCFGNIPFVLVGTKSDIPRTNKSISKARIEQCSLFETSAKLSQNVTELYNAAATLAMENYNKNKNPPITTRVIGPLEEVKPGYCC